MGEVRLIIFSFVTIHNAISAHAINNHHKINIQQTHTRTQRGGITGK